MSTAPKSTSAPKKKHEIIPDDDDDDHNAKFPWHKWSIDIDLRPHCARDKISDRLVTPAAQHPCGLDFRCILFPDGSSWTSKDYMSIFLQISNGDHLPAGWKAEVECTWRVINREKNQGLECLQKPWSHVFENSEDQGFAQSFRRDEIRALMGDGKIVTLVTCVRIKSTNLRLDPATEASKWWEFHSDLDLSTFYHYDVLKQQVAPTTAATTSTPDHKGYQFRCNVFPDGASDTSRGHLALFLEVANADQLPNGWRRYVEWEYWISCPTLPEAGQVECAEGSLEHLFDSGADTGYPKAFWRNSLVEQFEADRRPLRLTVRVRDAIEMPVYQGRTAKQWKKWIKGPLGKDWCDKKQSEARAVVDWMISHWGLDVLRSGEGVMEVGGEPGFLARELILSGVPVTVIDPLFGITGKANHYTELISAQTKLQSIDGKASGGGKAGAKHGATEKQKPMLRYHARAFDEEFVSDPSPEVQRLLKNASVAIALYPDEGTKFFNKFSNSVAEYLPSALLPCDDCRQFFPPEDPTHEGFVRHIMRTDAERLRARYDEGTCKALSITRERIPGLPYSQWMLHRNPPDAMKRFSR